MTRTVKRQIGFYADPDVEDYIDSLDAGVKTRLINAAIRAWMFSRQNIEAPAYNDTIESLSAWLAIQQDPLVVHTKNSKQEVGLAHLLRKFFHQNQLRPGAMTWPDVIDQGLTFPAPPSLSEAPSSSANGKPLMVPASVGNRCNSCQKPITNPAGGINTPSRGLICKPCFELPLKRS